MDVCVCVFGRESLHSQIITHAVLQVMRNDDDDDDDDEFENIYTCDALQ